MKKSLIILASTCLIGSVGLAQAQNAASSNQMQRMCPTAQAIASHKNDLVNVFNKGTIDQGLYVVSTSNQDPSSGAPSQPDILVKVYADNKADAKKAAANAVNGVSKINSRSAQSNMFSCTYLSSTGLQVIYRAPN